MYAYLVFLHSPDADTEPFPSGAPCQKNPAVGYRFIFSPTPLGTPAKALGLYYSTIYGGVYTVAVHEFQFPADMTEEAVLALNPHKSTGPLVFGSVPMGFQCLEQYSYALGENNLKTKTEPERLVALFKAESEAAMAEERRLAARALWQVRYEFGVGAAPPSTSTPPTDKVMRFGGSQWVVPKNCPLVAILGGPFCPEVEVAPVVLPWALSALENSIPAAELKAAVDRIESAMPTSTGVAATSVVAQPASTRSKTVADVAGTLWKFFEERVLYIHPPNVKAPLAITKEALQFLWLYLAKGLKFNRLKDILETSGLPIVRETPEWWGDVTTHLGLLEFFNKRQLRPIYALRPAFLADAISLCKNFFGENWDKQQGLNYEALDTILYRPREIAEDEQNFLVRNFCQTSVQDASGGTVGSAAAHMEFAGWLTGINSSAKSHLPEAIATEILSIMNVGVFGATMKRLGYTMKRRAQGNVYLDVAIRRNGPAPPVAPMVVNFAFATVDDARTKILEEMAKTMDPKTANSAKLGGWLTSNLEKSVMFDGMGSTGPYEPQYAEP